MTMDTVTTKTSYEQMVQRNIEENRRVLRNLGFSSSFDVPKIEQKKPQRRSRKSYTPRPEVKQPEIQYRSGIRTRRSSVLNTTDCDEFNNSSYTVGEENTSPNKKRKSIREHTFGEIEGVSVGDWWMTRIECSAAGVHRPTVAGIHGKVGEGCYSIALSGGYEDDLDCGEFFTYTGSGGRDLKGTKSNPKNLRTAPQSKDQVLEGSNAALASNIESKRPVRVIRGYKLQGPYAPEEGYRYDGLYSVEKHWTAQGHSGFKVIKFALKRLPDQDPAPWKSNSMIVSPNKIRSVQIPAEVLIPEVNIPLTNGISPKEEHQSPATKACISTPQNSEKEMLFKKISPKNTRSKKEVSLTSEMEHGVDMSDIEVKSNQKNEVLPLIDRASSSEEARVPIEESTISEESSSVNNVVPLQKRDCDPPNLHRTSKKLEKDQSLTPSPLVTRPKREISSKETQENNSRTDVSLRSSNENEVDKKNKTDTSQSKAHLICSTPSPNTHANSKQHGHISEPVEKCQQDNCNDLQNESHPVTKFENDKSPDFNAFTQNNICENKVLFASSNNLTPVKTKTTRSTTLELNPRQASELVKMTVSPVNLSEKNVKFSPKITDIIHYTNEKGIGLLSDEKENATDQEDDALINTSCDLKKQMSILKYFPPVKTVVEIESQKNTVNPKSLRGNRFSSFSMNLSIDNQFKLNDDMPSKNSKLEDNSIDNLKYNESKSSRKRKFTSPFNIEASKKENGLNPKVSKLNKESKPTKMLETLMKKNKNYRLQSQKSTLLLRESKSKSSSPVQECSVKLWKVEESFLGWDFDDNEKFHGFSKEESQSGIDEERDFLGWDPCIAHSSKGLVAVGFLIDTLSNNNS